MWYNSKHTKILDSQEWYDLIADEYGKYHKHLDSFYSLDLNRFLPNEENLKIVDLWAGDWRLYKTYEWVKVSEYFACDISRELLKNHPKNINTNIHILDLDDKFDLPEDYFDFATAFFVLEHLQDLDNFFNETYKILKQWWRLVIGHFLQRREFEWKKNNETFKIRQYKHRLENIKECAENNFFDFHYFECREKWNLLWYVIVCEKN